MKNNWPTKKLGDVADILMGQSPPGDAYNETGLGMPLINGPVELGPLYPRKSKFTSKLTRVSKKGDILLSIRATLGILNWSDDEYCLGRGVAAIRPTDASLLKGYLWYLLLNYSHKIKDMAVGAIIRGINKDNLAELNITLPPLAIQKKVVEKLDAIRKAKELCDNQIQKTEELYGSILFKEFSGKSNNSKSLEELAEITSSKRIHMSDYVDSGVPFYRTKEIVEFSKDLPMSVELFISNNQFEEIKCRFGSPKKGDILISAVGTIGITWIVPNDNGFYFKDGNLLWLRNFRNIDSRYLNYFLDYSFGSVLKLAAGGAYKALTITKLKKFKIPVKSYTKQVEIVEKLDAIQNYKKLLFKQKSLLQELFDSVLYKSMNGEMDH